jgi:hypothetical protein
MMVDYSKTIFLPNKVLSMFLVCVLEFLSVAKGSGGLMVLCHFPILEFYGLYGIWSSRVFGILVFIWCLVLWISRCW